jgi:hypothetical protein
MELYRFYASIHARPEEATAGPQVQLQGQLLDTLHVPPPLLAQPLDRNFEDTIEILSRWERMFVEPDGSFVWVSSQNATPWQVDGNLYDRDELLAFLDIKGCCPPAEFDRLLGALGWPETALMFQLTREGVFLAEAEFRRFALACGGTPDQPREIPRRSPARDSRGDLA